MNERLLTTIFLVQILDRLDSPAWTESPFAGVKRGAQRFGSPLRNYPEITSVFGKYG